jgi:type III pantothenate kinase
LKLIVDIGNTTIKCALFEQNKIVGKFIRHSISKQDLHSFFEQFGTPKQTIVVNVRSEENFQFVWNILGDLIDNILIFDHSVKTPLVNLYQTPETLGYDRLAMAVAANFLYPNRNLLVISVGTALTYELISENGEYLGGNISPGLELRFKALHDYTGKLPLCQPQPDAVNVGRTTQEAIVAGVQNGIIYEIQTNIEQFYLKYQNSKVLLTGGDAIFFEPQLKNEIFVVLDLVLIGLNRILDYNANLD